MRILYHHRTQGGWVEAVHIRNIVEGLRELGNDVCLVGPPLASPATGDGAPSPSRAARALRLAARKLPQSAFELLEIAYNAAAYPRLMRAARETGAEALYERAAAFGIAGALAAQQLRIPLIVEFNDVAGQAGVRQQRLPGLARALEAAVLRRLAAAITVTSYLRDQLVARGVPAERVTVLPNGVDPSRFHPDLDGRPIREKYGIGPGDCLVGFTGAMSRWYRLSEVAEEFARSFSGAPQMRLLLIGDGPEREAIGRKIASLGCGSKILMGPRIPHDEVPVHVAAFDIALIPHCDRHNSPVKLFEYLGAGKPVVAVRTPGITDVVTHEREALLTDAGDLTAVMHAVRWLSENPAEAAALGRRGRELVLARHTWQQNAQRTFTVLTTAFAGAEGAARQPASLALDGKNLHV